MSTYPQFSFNNPTSSVERGIVDRGLSLLLPVEADLKFGALGFSVEAGYLLREFDPDAWILGEAGGYRLFEGFQLLGEIYTVFSEAQEDKRVLLNLGTRLKRSHRGSRSLTLLERASSDREIRNRYSWVISRCSFGHRSTRSKNWIAVEQA